VEARRYRVVARHLDIAALPTMLRVSGRAVEELLAGRVRFLTLAQATRFEGAVSAKVAAWLKESPRFKGIGGGELPVALIEPLLLDAFERYGREGTAGMCGMEPRSLFRILTCSTAITFALADRIVTGIAGPSWWRDDPERLGWYWGHSARL
jgi:plasmid maintenance system antidote protein VapI